MLMHPFLFGLLFILLCGCTSPRRGEAPTGPRLRVLTYNVNWAGVKPELTTEIIRNASADVVCLQETTPQCEKVLRQNLASEYPFMEFRNSFAFLSKRPGNEVAYIPSNTGWFDGWIVAFETEIGPVQILNVHLRPPVSDRGSWISGYLTTRDDRVREMERFYSQRREGVPLLICGDFNDGEDSQVIRWLEKREMVNALPQFDSGTPTWQWRVGVVTLKRRMDHIVYSPELRCASARVIRGGSSDHFPVEAVFVRQ